MANHGDYNSLGTVDFNFTSLSTGGSPFSLANGTINVYRSNSLTESASGVTLTPDYDGRTGLNHVHIETGANISFYANGNDYNVVLIVGQIAGVAVDGYELGEFSIGNRSSPGSGSTDWSAAERTQIRDALGVDGTKATSTGGVVNTVATATANIQTRLPTVLTGGRMDSQTNAWGAAGTPLMPTVQGRTLDVTITGEAGVDWSNIGAPTTTVNLSGTTVKTITDALTVGTNNDKTGYTLTSAERDNVANALLDLSNAIETSMTMRQAFRLMAATLGGILAGAGTTSITIRSAVSDSKVRVTAVVDSSGDRTSFVYDLT